MRMSSVRTVDDTLEHRLTFFLYFVPHYRHFSSRLHFQNRLKGSNGVAPTTTMATSSTQCNDVLDEVLRLVSGPVNYHSQERLNCLLLHYFQDDKKGNAFRSMICFGTDLHVVSLENFISSYPSKESI
jgi:hypothetical protein